MRQGHSQARLRTAVATLPRTARPSGATGPARTERPVGPPPASSPAPRIVALAAWTCSLHAGAKVRQGTVNSPRAGVLAGADWPLPLDQPTRVAIAVKLFAIAAQ